MNDPLPTEDHDVREENPPTTARRGDLFEPSDLSNEPCIKSDLPPEVWTIVQSTPANFTPHYFLEVSRNLLENPNLTASHLSRAELSYQSFTDASYNPSAQHPHDLASIVKHMKTDHQPILVANEIPGYSLEWTVVRKLIPRNPKLDEPLIQTCHLLTSTDQVVVTNQDGSEETIEAERYLVIYLPHVTDPIEIPFYHPKVRALAILYSYQATALVGQPLGTLSLYYHLFPEYPLDNRLSRTALKMLEIIHKHSRGRMAGYQKRVHHDVVIPQKPFQDTYAYLKGKYAKGLIDNWVEQTPAEKHVFEDLGIAAFLIELWTDMYGGVTEVIPIPKSAHVPQIENTNSPSDSISSKRSQARNTFPGFLDIGCGNGLLVWILNSEGWHGWGFDARRRKTWDTFGPSYSDKLKEMLLVPAVFEPTHPDSPSDTPPSNGDSPQIHNGIVPQGTFVIANHADELTIWAPCLAFLSDSPFLAIPCCSHNFGGTRFRAPNKPAYSESTAEKGKPAASKQPSAYASFCSYVSHLTSTMGYVPEKEFLRIPSTRNVAIIGRKKIENERSLEGEGREGREGREGKFTFVKKVVEKEMPDTSIEQVKMQWLKRGDVLMKPGKGSGH
ncbi:hypothetical protein B0J11DRAFT_537648 [Dendryphion nanum]|uniref:tRNA (uracil-O(2)-)-methyltransferase n=1 Tax=Dendryphion nanum TaxID=256645 RepID=A0A9P9IEU9_9PLEO|nr:hypothetical protein B0J11DRAFT_537648 [Dendryphion nanum]